MFWCKYFHLLQGDVLYLQAELVILLTNSLGRQVDPGQEKVTVDIIH